MESGGIMSEFSCSSSVRILKILQQTYIIYIILKIILNQGIEQTKMITGLEAQGMICCILKGY